jgi:hypothetical protein
MPVPLPPNTLGAPADPGVPMPVPLPPTSDI